MDLRLIALPVLFAAAVIGLLPACLGEPLGNCWSGLIQTAFSLKDGEVRLPTPLACLMVGALRSELPFHARRHRAYSVLLATQLS